jgi:hypothetical protein
VKYKWLLPLLPLMMLVGLDNPPPESLTIRCLRLAGALFTSGVFLVITRPWEDEDSSHRRAVRRLTREIGQGR